MESGLPPGPPRAAGPLLGLAAGALGVRRSGPCSGALDLRRTWQGEPQSGAGEVVAKLGRVDVVDVFRSPEHVPAVVEQFLARGDGALWLQEGVIDHASALKAAAAGRAVVMDRCTAKVAASL